MTQKPRGSSKKFHPNAPEYKEQLTNNSTMSKVWLIIKREYFTRVRNKTFILSTILLPLFFIGFIAACKGKSVPSFCLLCFIPLVNVVASIWLASLTDAAISRRLADLERTTPPAI